MTPRNLSNICCRYLEGAISKEEYLRLLFILLNKESEEHIINFATVLRFIADLQTGHPLDGRS